MVTGRTARRSHSRKNGHVSSPLRRMPNASGMHGPQGSSVPKVPGRPGGRVELHDLPAGRPGLYGQRRDETVDRRRVRKVP